MKSVRRNISNDNIEDDQIRIIGSASPTDDEDKIASRKPRGRNRMRVVVALAIALCCIVLIVIKMLGADSPIAMDDDSMADTSQEMSTQLFVTSDVVRYGDNAILMITPPDVTPILQVGSDVINNGGFAMAMPAADVRQDNGDINGSFVLNGELLARGTRNAGYCAIIDGEVYLGVSDESPLLEKAIESGGYFFRNIPLVSNGDPVQHKSSDKYSLRALALIDDHLVVAIACNKMSYAEFTEALIDAGATDAIRLVGGAIYGEWVSEGGIVSGSGLRDGHVSDHSSYIVWR